MSERKQCCVPFCRRTTTKHPDSTEIICGKHWRLVPKSWRRRYRRVKSRYERSSSGDEASRLWTLVDRMWQRAKARAIEAAGGIA